MKASLLEFKEVEKNIGAMISLKNSYNFNEGPTNLN